MYLFICWIIILVFLLVTTPTKCIFNSTSDKSKEGFHATLGYHKKYCPSCGTKSRKSCSKCLNCGFCVTSDGHGECVPGDSNGPYFRDDCMYWEYGYNYADSFYPYSHIFPSAHGHLMYPYFRWRDSDKYRSRVPQWWRRWHHRRRGKRSSKEKNRIK